MEPCPICGSASDPDRIVLREMLFGTRERFPYLRCPSCGVLRIETIPVDLATYYPPDYFDGSSAESKPPPTGLAGLADRSRTEARLFGSARRRARALRRWAPKAPPELTHELGLVQRGGLRSFDDPILDVGSGQIPSSLLRLRRLGFRHLTGVDPFLAGRSSYPGITLRRSTIHELSGKYRLITMHHSFEHVPDPRETLIAAERLLLPGGAILIRTPVMGTWFWETYGSDWWELDAPRHVYIHTATSLGILAADAGLVTTDVVWDSTFLEIVASEQIRRDLAWREPGSWFTRKPADRDDPTIQAYREQALRLNAEGRAGRAGFYLRRANEWTADGAEQ